MNLRYKLLAVLVIAVILTLILAPHVIVKVHAKDVNQISLSVGDASTWMYINMPIYVVDSFTLEHKLINVGINQSLIKSVTINQLPELPNNSIIIIDWPIIGPSLVINRSSVIPINTSSTTFRLIEDLIRRGDFIIIHGNSTEAPTIEYTLALAWSRTFNKSIIAIPKYVSGLDYVVAYGSSEAIIIGSYSLESALKIANDLWIPLIVEHRIADPSDLCMGGYGLAQINNTYMIFYGAHSYSDSFGTLMVDFCISWAGMVNEDYDGYLVGYAELYNFIEYVPNYGTRIKYLESFQDAYASYLVHKYLLGQISPSQLPGDVKMIASGSGYWTTASYTPYPMQCTKVGYYNVSLTANYISSAPFLSTTYACSLYTISVGKTPSTLTSLNYPAYNLTWVFKPEPAMARDAIYFGTEGDGYAYVGPAYSPKSSAYTIPAGVSVVVYRPDACTYRILGVIPIPGILVEHIIYDINWNIVVNSSGAVSSLSSGYAIPPPGINSGWKSSNSPYYALQGFYYTIQCNPIWWLWW